MTIVDETQVWADPSTTTNNNNYDAGAADDTDGVESDLMAAMDAALNEDNYLPPDMEFAGSEHSSLKSVDVMGEAMNLLLAGGEIDIDIDDGDVDDDGEEEIDFDGYLGAGGTAEISKNKNTAASIEGNDDAKDGSNETSFGGSSPTSVMHAGNNVDDPEPSLPSTPPTVETDETAGASKDDETKMEEAVTDGETNDNSDTEAALSSPAKSKPVPKQPQVVPLQQFQNALALIQDLENRIQVLETDQMCLQEENNTLREETNNQATVLADLEAKLARFPKLLEQTVQEEAKVAAAKAEAETKFSFWKKDIARQEQEFKEEKMKKNRKGKHSATTESLKQSDFLKDAVERKEQEKEQAEENTPANAEDGKEIKKKQGGGLFRVFRGWGNNNNNKNENNNKEEVDENEDDENKVDEIKDETATKDAETVSTSDDSGADKENEREKKNIKATNTTSKKKTVSQNNSNHEPQKMVLDGDGDANETNHGIEDNIHGADNEKVLDLLT
mmetsp:Transcript_11223/g.23787  ORF Transcript_11223/g.23787 Transcript_11223/m.23787 type:complete len:502 (+) Transcript_11223:61-1566(+)